MKTFTIVYLKTVREDKVLCAKNEKEARKAFQKMMPDERIVDVQQWSEFQLNYKGIWL